MQIGIRAQGLIVDHKQKGILGSEDKSPNHCSSGSQSPLQKCTGDLEFVA